jgi:hypothetical protein
MGSALTKIDVEELAGEGKLWRPMTRMPSCADLHFQRSGIEEAVVCHC